MAPPFQMVQMGLGLVLIGRVDRHFLSLEVVRSLFFQEVVLLGSQVYLEVGHLVVLDCQEVLVLGALVFLGELMIWIENL